MKNRKVIYLSIILLSVLFAQCKNVTDKDYSKVKVTNEVDSVSYFLGTLWGTQAVRNKISKLNYDALIKGFDQAMKSDSTMSPDFIASAYVNKFVNKKYEAEMRESKKDYIEKNAKFLEDNAKKDGVITLSSGLQYQILKEGNGPRPTLKDKVKVNYTATLIDGTKFDSSYDKGEPAVFGLNGMIKGFSEALVLMPVGSKWKIFIPESLAYGAYSKPPIEPFSTLIFEVELLDIVNGGQGQAAPQN